MGRYDGKPFLRLLEQYVMWSIGQLAEKDRQLLEQMTPKLKTTFSQTGSWQEIIQKVMELPPDLPEKIRQMWDRNQDIARQTKKELTAQDFAVAFVDANLTQ